MSKLLKHLGFGGKKNHKHNIDHKKKSPNNEESIRSTSKLNLNSTKSSAILRNNDSNDVLHPTRRLPVNCNESSSDKYRNSNTHSKSIVNKRDMRENVNQNCESRKTKNQTSRDLKEQAPPPVAEYSDPFDIKGRKITSDNSRVAKREDDYSYTLPYENKNKNKIADQSEYERPWDKTNEPTVDNHLDVQDVQCPNYEEPWDLSTTQCRIASNIISTSSPTRPAGCIETEVRRECVKAISNQRVQRSVTGDTYEAPWDYSAEQLDTRCKPQLVVVGTDHLTDSYDTPWDWKPERTDNRPADDSYESPWGDKDNKTKQKKPMQNKASTTSNNIVLKLDTRDTSMGYDEPWDKQKESINIKLYKIDENLPLKNQSWYHGAIGRLKAEQILLTSEEASFLVRQSESNRNDFSLSLKSTQGYMHMKIVRVNTQYILGQFSQPFASVPIMISHYTVHKLPIKGAEHMSLVYAIAAETL